MEDSNRFSTGCLWERGGGGGRGLSNIMTQYLSEAHSLLLTQGLLQIKTYRGSNVYGKDLMLRPGGLY